MTARRDRLLELATELVTARARVTELEAQIDELFGDGATRPGRRSTRRKEERGGSDGAGGAALPPVTNGTRQERIVALAKAGHDSGEIAEELGVPRKIIGMALWRARKAGDLPKAGASR
jgi:hypothetical protein